METPAAAQRFLHLIDFWLKWDPRGVASGGPVVSLLGEQACFCPQPGPQLLMTETGTHLGNQGKQLQTSQPQRAPLSFKLMLEMI